MARKRKRRTWFIGVIVAGGCAFLLRGWTPVVGANWIDNRLWGQIHSAEPDQRKQAAWATIETPSRRLADVMERGLLGAETDANVREAYAYSLGHIGDKRSFAAIEQTLDRDPSGLVRSTAWLAAARIDPRHFQTLAGVREATDNDWDRLGVAQGRLYLGDVSDLGDLFAYCRANDDTRAYIASRALRKWLWPLLDAEGLAPRNMAPVIGESWPAELVGEIERRCGEFDLRGTAEEIQAGRTPIDRTRRNVNRINGARRSAIEWLFGGDGAADG